MDECKFRLSGKAGRDQRESAVVPIDEIVDDAEPGRAFRMAFSGIVFTVADVPDYRNGHNDSMYFWSAPASGNSSGSLRSGMQTSSTFLTRAMTLNRMSSCRKASEAFSIIRFS